MDGDTLMVCLFYKSGKGVRGAAHRLQAISGQIDQLDDTEISGVAPVGQIDEVLKMLKASKVPLRNPRGNPESLRAPVSGRERRAESHEKCQVGSGTVGTTQ